MILERVTKPWGLYITKERGKSPWNPNKERWLKFLVFNPGHSLSLQSHEHREEWWEVKMGSGLVTIGYKVYIVKKGWNGYIAKGVKHRVQNDGPGLLVIKEHAEAAEGEILSETDLTRYVDQYGRV
jgi:mannose-6-phosphate isomerase-like protein (cupin superfamily)